MQLTFKFVLLLVALAYGSAAVSALPVQGGQVRPFTTSVKAFTIFILFSRP